MKKYVLQGKIGCVAWSSENSSMVISGDEKGQLVCFQYQENRTVCYHPESAAIMYLACSNFVETHIAVG